MKMLLFGLAVVFLFVSLASAEWVNGYFKKDGTRVNGYYRTERDSYEYNNRSYTESHTKKEWQVEKNSSLYGNPERVLRYNRWSGKYE